MVKVKGYNDYLKLLHSKHNTTRRIISRVIKEGTGKDLKSEKRIVAGEENEVYIITLSDQSQKILRISSKGYPYFQQEQWAIKETAS